MKKAQAYDFLAKSVQLDRELIMTKIAMANVRVRHEYSEEYWLEMHQDPSYQEAMKRLEKMRKIISELLELIPRLPVRDAQELLPVFQEIKVALVHESYFRNCTAESDGAYDRLMEGYSYFISKIQDLTLFKFVER